MKQRVGYLPENPYFYDYLTGWEFCRWQLDYSKSTVQRQRIPSY